MACVGCIAYAAIFVRRRHFVTASPFAAKFVAISPYAGNGLLRNFEPFNP
jgi:hypothetical protein